MRLTSSPSTYEAVGDDILNQWHTFHHPEFVSQDGEDPGDIDIITFPIEGNNHGCG